MMKTIERPRAGRSEYWVSASLVSCNNRKTCTYSREHRSVSCYLVNALRRGRGAGPATPAPRAIGRKGLGKRCPSWVSATLAGAVDTSATPPSTAVVKEFQ
jgi:hypothetical protein